MYFGIPAMRPTGLATQIASAIGGANCPARPMPKVEYSQSQSVPRGTLDRFYSPAFRPELESRRTEGGELRMERRDNQLYRVFQHLGDESRKPVIIKLRRWIIQQEAGLYRRVLGK